MKKISERLKEKATVGELLAVGILLILFNGLLMLALIGMATIFNK